MAFFFNGRLWITPDVMSMVDDSAMFNVSTNVGNVLAIVGQSTGGQPQTPLIFSDPNQAAAVLRSGDLLDAVVRAFDASAETQSPFQVAAIRVNPAVQATLDLLNGSAQAVIHLASTDYGLWTNQIKAKIENATNVGKKLTTQVGNAYFIGDDVHRNAFSVQYSGGNASATMSVTGTAVSLEAPVNTVVATIDLNTYATVTQLVDRINSVAGFNATVLDGNDQAPTLNGLDGVTEQDVRTALYTATAHLQACVDWFNGLGEGFVTATRAAGAVALPANIPFTYLAGGTDGTTTNNDWTGALNVLQTVDVQAVVAATSDPAIIAATDAHVAFMSVVARRERRAFHGMALGTSDAQALALAKSLNSDRSGVVHLGGWDYDSTGKLKLFQPYIVAAMVAGGFCGMNPGKTMTNKSLKLFGVERALRTPTDTDPLVAGGVIPIAMTPTGIRVIAAKSTWQTNKNFNRVEISTGYALDFVARTVRDAVANIKGAPGSPQTLSLAIAEADTALRQMAKPEPIGPGVIVGNDASPAFKNLTASLQGDVVMVSFQCSPVIPVNYVAVSIFAVPFSATVTA